MNDPKKNNAERLGAVRINNGQLEAQLLRERDTNGATVVHAVRRTAYVHERLRSAGKLAPELFDAAEKFRMDFERSGARFTHSLLEKTRNLGCSGTRRLIGRQSERGRCCARRLGTVAHQSPCLVFSGPDVPIEKCRSRSREH